MYLLKKKKNWLSSKFAVALLGFAPFSFFKSGLLSLALHFFELNIHMFVDLFLFDQFFVSRFPECLRAVEADLGFVFVDSVVTEGSSL